MIDILERCDKLYKKEKCCHTKRRCNCYSCLNEGFFVTSDTYECFKKHLYYVMNYGPSYSSEIYNYLKHSQILENNFNNKNIKILSLGCGFAPDLIALEKYIENENLDINFEYTGLDASTGWSKIRNQASNVNYITIDINTGFDLSEYDIVFIVKLFSTLYNNDLDGPFLTILQDQITNNLKNGSFLIFIDVNSCYEGRDIFNGLVKNLFTSSKLFFYNVRGAYQDNFEEIQYTNITFDVPDSVSISPLMELNKTIVFEYKK
jgi:hypothetical protein